LVRLLNPIATYQHICALLKGVGEIDQWRGYEKPKPLKKRPKLNLKVFHSPQEGVIICF